jgi:hypothetical protein
MVLPEQSPFPQGLKPNSFMLVSGTTKAVPFPKPVQERQLSATIGS